MNKYVYTDLELLPEDLQGWNGTSNLFNDLILKIKPRIIVEVGTWKNSVLKFAKENQLKLDIFENNYWILNKL